MIIRCFLFLLLLLTRLNYSFPIISFDPSQFVKSDLLLYDFRSSTSTSTPQRCLLQTESKFVYLNVNCQLLTRTSFKSQCQFEDRLKIEFVYPQNTTVLTIVLQSNRTDCSSNRTNFSCQFEKNPYRIKLKENEFYKNFLQLKSFDSCLASNFVLSSTNSRKNFEYFSLNSTTGHLSLMKPLDFETNPTWKLVIQGEDKFQIPFYTYVIIDVDDVNDCPPLLSWNFPSQTIEIVNDTDAFQMEILIEESKVEEKNVIIANLIASDLDSPLKFDLNFDEKNASLPFRIDGPYGDSTYVLITTERLDREEKSQHVLKLILSDSGKPRLSSTYQLIIDLIDTNDHRPKFDQQIYHVDIQENNFLNTTLLQIFANDSDADENGRVSYAFDPPNRDDLSIDSRTGIIRTKIRFDYENLTNFSFDVVAFDHPTKDPKLETRAKVMVKIIDQNDNVPQFRQSHYEFSIDENNSPNSYLGQVEATDGDASSSSKLTYFFHQATDEILSLFHLSASDGKIFVRQTLDREENDRYEFFIVVSDGYHRSTPLPVVVYVRDENDEIPRFIFPNDQNDTLVIDRQFWNFNDFICEIQIEDFDLIQNYSLILIYRFDQLKHYEYLDRQIHPIKFHSDRFFLDRDQRLFYKSINGSTLDEGVFYVALKLIDGENYFEEKILKLIVVDGYHRLETVLQRYDYLGLHLNNRFAYLKNHHGKISQRLNFDSSNKYLLLSVLAFATFILIGIVGLFVALLKFRFWKKKQTPTKPIDEKKSNLHVRNCFDYNDTSLLMFNKDPIGSTTGVHDHSALLNNRIENDQQRNQIYSSWFSSTFQSFNHVSVGSPTAKSDFHPIAVVSSSNPTHTPVSSDDGFCGSSDISDPSIPNGNTHLLTSYRTTPFFILKEPVENVDSQRRVRFNLNSDDRLKRFEQMYMTSTDDYDRPPFNSTIV